MSLPELNVPILPIPVGIPEMFHPFAVHFAIAIPVLIILMELVNLLVKKRTIGVLSFVFMLLLTAILYIVFLSGLIDAEKAGKAVSAGSEAGSVFDSHKTAGIYLFYGSAILLFVKLLSVTIRKTPLKILFLLFLIFFCGMSIVTAGKGQKLVYEYGVNTAGGVTTEKGENLSATAQKNGKGTEVSASSDEKRMGNVPVANNARPDVERNVSSQGQEEPLGGVTDSSSSGTEVSRDANSTSETDMEKMKNPSSQRQEDNKTD
jgi:uncharacterized membrane protein